MDEQGRARARGAVEELDLEPAAAVRTRRPRALWAVLAVVGVAAGAPGGHLRRRRRRPASRPPGRPGRRLPVRGGAEAAADSMLAWVTYVPGDDLPALGGEATAYRLSGEVDEAQVRELADALGLDGDVESDDDGAWSVDGGGAGRLDVYAGGGAYWSYFARATATASPRTAASTAAAPGGAVETSTARGLRHRRGVVGHGVDRRADVRGRRRVRRADDHDRSCASRAP